MESETHETLIMVPTVTLACGTPLLHLEVIGRVALVMTCRILVTVQLSHTCMSHEPEDDTDDDPPSDSSSDDSTSLRLGNNDW